METFSILILIGIFISSIVNLAIELGDTHTIKQEYILRSLFCSLAVGTVHPILHVSKDSPILIYLSVLYFLVNRIIVRLRELKVTYKNT